METDARIVSRTYDQIGSVYDEWAEPLRVEERRKYIDEIKRRLRPGSTILDVGCGGGLRHTQDLAEAHHVLGIDVSQRQVLEAQRNVPHATFICGDVREQAFAAGSFDAVVSFYCFGHVARESYARMFRQFHIWLKPDGLFVASFGTMDSAHWVGEWLGATTFFSSHPPRRTLDLIARAGFQIAGHKIETALEDGNDASFLWVIATR